MTATRVRKTRAATTAADYAHSHSDSPIAKACADVGPVWVVDNLRADIAHAAGTSQLRRCYGLGVCSASHGFAPDVHQHASGLWPGLSPADYLARWISTALQWADRTEQSPACDPDAEDEYNAARLAQLDQWAAELVTCAPVWYVDWLARLVHPPKWGYLVELGAHQWLGAPPSYDPGAEWVDKMGRQWARRHQSDAVVTRVVEALEQF